METKTFDFIVVGAGSAGCVLADKLSDGAKGGSVLVLEAGGSDQKVWIKVPIGYGKTFYDEAVNWKFMAQPDTGLNQRQIYFPRGKVVGGSSSINAMVWARGLPSDYNDWAAMGHIGWSWADVKPVFESIEHRVNSNGQTTNQDKANGKGALYVSDVKDQLHPTEKFFFDGALQTGLPFTDDFNGDQPEGVGRYQINTYKGKRWSAADAFLRPALKRGKAQLITGAMVQKVLFEGNKAVGVEYLHNGNMVQVRATRAVVLSSGAIQTPQLLQVSGVGPAALLQANGVAVVLDSPHVGQNMQDHLAMSYYYKATKPTLNNLLSPWWGKLKVGIQYVFGQKGPLSISVNQCGGFVKSNPDQANADMQLYCNPITYTLSSSGKSTHIIPDKFAGFILCYQPCRPLSRGSVEITSPSMQDAPSIKPNYLSHPEDQKAAIRGGRLIQQLAQSAAIKGLIKAPIAPDCLSMTDEQLLEDFRQRASTCYHPVGTCVMGQSIATSVVSPQLKVHGLESLFVVDASVMPTVTSGNTHAPTTLIAHKGAQNILQLV